MAGITNDTFRTTVDNHGRLIMYSEPGYCKTSEGYIPFTSECPFITFPKADVTALLTWLMQYEKSQLVLNPELTDLEIFGDATLSYERLIDRAQGGVYHLSSSGVNRVSYSTESQVASDDSASEKECQLSHFICDSEDGGKGCYLYHFICDSEDGGKKTAALVTATCEDQAANRISGMTALAWLQCVPGAAIKNLGKLTGSVDGLLHYG